METSENTVRRYRKKPVEIEAIRLTTTNCRFVINWIGHPAQKLAQTFDEGVNIETPEGIHLARYGDYIIRGIHGEHYPCKADIFEKTYESVE